MHIDALQETVADHYCLYYMCAFDGTDDSHFDDDDAYYDYVAYATCNLQPDGVVVPPPPPSTDRNGDLIEQLGHKAHGICADDGLQAGYPLYENDDQWHLLPVWPYAVTPQECARRVEALGNATAWIMRDVSFKHTCLAA